MCRVRARRHPTTWGACTRKAQLCSDMRDGFGPTRRQPHGTPPIQSLGDNFASEVRALPSLA